MLKVKLVATLAFFVFLTPVSLTPVFAQSLTERIQYASEDKSMAKAVESIAGKCKVTIPAKIDWSTFKGFDFKTFSPSGYCRIAYSAIGDICEMSEDGLKSVQSRVKGLTCKQASPSTLTLENGELVYGFDFKNDYNVRDMVRAFLIEKL